MIVVEEWMNEQLIRVQFETEGSKLLVSVTSTTTEAILKTVLFLLV
jgi:hypothetical protein